MIQKTRWHPDTCDCVMEYSWDDSTSEDQRVHSISNIISKCSFHKSLPDSHSVYSAVLKENVSKNKAVSLLVSTFPALAGKEKEITWYFNDDRSINVDHPSLKVTDLATFADVVKNSGIELPVSLSISSPIDQGQLNLN